MTAAPAIIILGPSALPCARRIQTLYPQADIHGLGSRVTDIERTYEDFGDTLRTLYRAGTPIIALCAAGIVIRSLAAALGEKGGEPPVLAVAEDGSAVVPLLGGLGGVNRMAREIAAHLDVSPAITTSGELRFGPACWSRPPAMCWPISNKAKALSATCSAAKACASRATHRGWRRPNYLWITAPHE